MAKTSKNRKLVHFGLISWVHMNIFQNQLEPLSQAGPFEYHEHYKQILQRGKWVSKKENS